MPWCCAWCATAALWACAATAEEKLECSLDGPIAGWWWWWWWWPSTAAHGDAAAKPLPGCSITAFRRSTLQIQYDFDRLYGRRTPQSAQRTLHAHRTWWSLYFFLELDSWMSRRFEKNVTSLAHFRTCSCCRYNRTHSKPIYTKLGEIRSQQSPNESKCIRLFAGTCSSDVSSQRQTRFLLRKICLLFVLFGLLCCSLLAHSPPTTKTTSRKKINKISRLRCAKKKKWEKNRRHTEPSSEKRRRENCEWSPSVYSRLFHFHLSRALMIY